ncbi:MAG TPA: phosphatase PAP2 family protein [Thermoanaerobaculia bacterium]|nr:phosphatase PAP2 family protein [Thermoanaerobaculia bacterium]
MAVLALGGAAITIWAGDAFIDVAELVHSRSVALQEFDSRIHDLAITERSPIATAVLVGATTIGSPVSVGVIVAIVATVLIIQHRYRWAIYLVGTTGLGALMLIELKRYFARARPDLAEALRRASGYSFPSGHAMGSTIVFGALGYLALRSLRTWRAKAAALAAAFTLVITIALSRVYLGVHWISDVGAGVAVGALWVAIATVAYETSRRIRMIRARRASSTAR